MKQIELVLQNDGVKRNVIFPCTESEYQTTCKELELKDNYAFVRDESIGVKKGHVREFGRDKLSCKKNG